MGNGSIIREERYVSRNLLALLRNHYCRGKAISITNSECLCVVLVFQHAKRVRHIMFSSVAILNLQYSSTLSPERHDFRKRKNLLNTKCVFLFYLQILSESFITLRRIQLDITINVKWIFM
jgi:hypothetical protein